MAVPYLSLEDPDGNIYNLPASFWMKSEPISTSKNIVNKAGYRVLILQDGMNETDAFTLEKYLIVFYGRADLGEGRLVNLTDGGDGSSGLIHSEENRKKLGESFKGKKHSEESRKKMSDAAKGRKAQTVSEETRKKLSEAVSKNNKGCKWFNDGTKNLFIKLEDALPHYNLGMLKKNNP